MLLPQLEAEVQQKLQEINIQLAVQQKLQTEHDLHQARVDELTQQIQNIEEAKVVLTIVEQTQQGQLKEKVEKYISAALRAIFERALIFQVDFETRGNQSDAVFSITDEAGAKLPLRDAHGGGLLVVVSFLLRIIVLLSAKPALRPIIFADEILVQVSDEYRTRLVDFLQRFAKITQVQLIFVTHSPELAAIGDIQYKFTLEGGITKVERY